jgi:hypothetical protein
MTPFFKSIKQTTIGVIDTRFDYQVTIYLELMMIYLGGTFLFGFSIILRNEVTIIL